MGRLILRVDIEVLLTGSNPQLVESRWTLWESRLQNNLWTPLPFELRIHKVLVIQINAFGEAVFLLRDYQVEV